MRQGANLGSGKMMQLGEIVDFGGGFLEDSGEGGLFVGGKMTEDKIDVAEFGADFGAVSAEAEARKFGGAEMARDGFEAVVATTAAFGAEAQRAKRQVEIIANDQNVGGCDFIELGELGNSLTGIVIKSLGFNKDRASLFEPDGVEFEVLPSEIVDLGIEVES